MVKDWNFYFDRSFYECKDYNLLFSKARSFGQVLDLAMDDQYIYILYLDQLLSEYDYNDAKIHGEQGAGFQLLGSTHSQVDIG